MSDSIYKAKSAHLAVMAELAWRGYNVAMPEIDIGDDIFAVRDDTGNMWRIQVKYGKVTKQKKSIAIVFSCRQDQVDTPCSPELYYVFAFRDTKWRFCIMPRATLKTHRDANQFGSSFVQKRTGKQYLNFRLSLSNLDILTYGSGANKKDVSQHLEKWDEIPSR